MTETPAVKRVIITSNAYLPNIGGIENSLFYLAISYRDLGYEVEVIVSDINTVNDLKLPKYEVLNGITIYRYSSYQYANFIVKPFRSVVGLVAMYRLLVNRRCHGQPHLVISRFHFNTIVAKLAGLNNITYLVPGVVKHQNKADNTSFVSGFSKVKHALQLKYHVIVQNNAFKVADRLFVFSENMRDQISSLVSQKLDLKLTKPGVDVSRFIALQENEKKRLRNKLCIPEDKKILLMVGRFVRAKGIMFALEAMIKLDGYHLVLVGSGEEEKLYRSFISSNKLEMSVTIFGAQQDPVPFYQCADVFLMLSIYEPFGQTILEAMSSKLPILAFSPDAGVQTATSEILSQSAAIYVEQCNAESIVKRLKEQDGNLNTFDLLGKQGRELAANLFTWERLARSLLL